MADGQNAGKEAQEEKSQEQATPAIMVAESAAEASSPEAEQQQQQQQQQPGETTACLEEAEGAGGDKRKGGTLGRMKMPKKPNIKAPKVAGKRVTLERDSDQPLDVISRDPKQINQDFSVQFEDVIAEPDPTVFSFDMIWTISFAVFSNSKLWCYRILSLLCSIPAALCWGLQFAMLSFWTIWCWQPQLRAMEIKMFYLRRVFEICLRVFMEPCFNSIGKCLSHVVVTVRREG